MKLNAGHLKSICWIIIRVSYDVLLSKIHLSRSFYFHILFSSLSALFHKKIRLAMMATVINSPMYHRNMFLLMFCAFFCSICTRANSNLFTDGSLVWSWSMCQCPHIVCECMHLMRVSDMSSSHFT